MTGDIMVADLRARERLAAPVPEGPGAPGAGVPAAPTRARREHGRAPPRPSGRRPIVVDWHGFHTTLRNAAIAATQSGAPLSLLMLELGAGMESTPCSTVAGLEALAGIIAKDLGQMHALARYGEGRLAVILMGANLGQALFEAERLARSVASRVRDQTPTAIGVAQFRDDESLGHLIERVRAAVSRAKSDGSRVVVAEHRRRRPWQPRGGAALCLCGRHGSPCACGLA